MNREAVTRISYRPMQAGDVDECVAIVRQHPIIGPRYAGALEDLRAAWTGLFALEAKCAVVLTHGARLKICYFGISVFVNDEFVREIKRAPGFWFGPELARRVVRGGSPILSRRQLEDLNSGGDGLNLLVWEGTLAPGHELSHELMQCIMTAFIQEHRGYRLKEVISTQLDTAERLHWTLYSGGLLWEAVKQCYESAVEGDADEIVRTPHIIGITRSAELDRRGTWSTWVGALFDYHPPVLGLTSREQQQLLLALGGRTDDELAAEFGRPLTAVKSTWRSIYARVAPGLPELSETDARAAASARGREKRRRLLRYLRDHPEELRPISRKKSRGAHAHMAGQGP
jgi:hypothetical protein